MQKHTFRVQKHTVKVQKYIFKAQKHTFKVQKYTFNVQECTFKLQKDSFNVQKHTFKVQKHTFKAQKHTFNVEKYTCKVQQVYFQLTKNTLSSTRVYFRSTEWLSETLARNLLNTSGSWNPVPRNGSVKTSGTEPNPSEPMKHRNLRNLGHATEPEPWNRKTCRNPSKPGPSSQNWFPEPENLSPMQNRFPEPVPGTSSQNQFQEPGSFPEPPQLAQNTPKSILCKDPIAFCCLGKKNVLKISEICLEVFSVPAAVLPKFSWVASEFMVRTCENPPNL